MKDFNTHNFLQLLDKQNIKYHYEDKWLVIDGDNYGYVSLNDKKITSLPDYIMFNNDGWIDFSYNGLTTLPDNIEFNNGGNVNLNKNFIVSLPDTIKFNNLGYIYFDNNPLESLPSNIDEFYNRLDFIVRNRLKKTFPNHWFFEKERFGL